MLRFFLFLFPLFLGAQVAFSQDARALTESAINLNRDGSSLEGQERYGVFVDVRRILDRIVVEHPDSPEAMTIRAGGFLGDLSVAALDAQLSGQATAPKALPDEMGRVGDSALLYDSAPLALPPGTAAIPPAPRDPKSRTRAIQEALNSVGCETGQPDGVSGRKTTRGYKAFLKNKGLEERDYGFESDAFWQVLHSSKGVICEAMPVVPVTPQTMPGTWTYVANCGRNSKMPGQSVTGVVSLEHTGGSGFRGNLRNSQGLRASVVGTVKGRQVSLVTNFGFLFGKVSSVGTVADDAYVVHGRDSNGCRFTATKR